MEDINNKAYEDELNKAEDSIEETPREKITVPKPEKEDDDDNQDC